MTRRIEALAAPALLLVVCIGFFWRLLLTDEYTWMAGFDMSYQVLPWYQFQASEWHAGRFPLWDPNHWGGQPLLAQGQPGAAYPLNWILFSLPLRDGWIQHQFLNWYFVLIHYLAALFSYLLCRDLGRSRAAAILAGLVFGLGGYVGSTDWPQMLNGAVWAPLVFLFLLRSLRGQNPVASAAMSGMFLGIAFLSGHHQIPIYTALAAAGVWLWHWGQSRGHGLVHAVVFAMFTGLTAAFQALPSYEYGKLALRWVSLADPVSWNEKVPYLVHAQFSLAPLGILGTFLAGFQRHANPFLGWTALSLVVLGIAAGWQRPVVRILALTGLGGLVFAFGANSMVHGVLYSVLPVVDKARNPAMAIFLVHLAAAPLVAFGLDALRENWSLVWTRRFLIGGAGAGAFLLLVLLALVQTGNARPDTHAGVAMAGVAALLAAAAAAAFTRQGIGAGALAAALTGVALLELSAWSAPFLVNRRDEARMQALRRLAENSDIVEFLRKQEQPLRVDVDDKEIPHNFGDWHGIEQSGGYLASLTSNIFQMQIHAERGRKLFAVNYAIARAATRPDQQLVFEGASGLKVFRNPDVLPRVRFVPGEKCGSSGEARILESHPGWTRIETQATCAGMAVLAETWYPGWKAAVDGSPVAVQQVDGALRGVAVEAGVHVIEMRFRPASVYVGAALSAAGMFCAIAMSVLLRGARAVEGPN